MSTAFDFKEKIKKIIEELEKEKWGAVERALNEELSKLKKRKPKKVKIKFPWEKKSKVRLQTRSIIIKRLETNLYPNVKRVELKGIAEKWHSCFIIPFSRTLLQQLGAYTGRWKTTQPVEYKVSKEGETIEEKKYVAVGTEALGHLFESDYPFLYCIIPINAPTFYEASVKAVVIYNPHDVPIKITILHLNHGTSDTVEIPPRHVMIFVHYFKESLGLIERKSKAKARLEEIEKKLREAGLSEQTIKNLVKKYEEIIKSHNYLTDIEQYEKMSEEAFRRKLYELKKEIKKGSKDWIII